MHLGGLSNDLCCLHCQFRFPAKKTCGSPFRIQRHCEQSLGKICGRTAPLTHPMHKPIACPKPTASFRAHGKEKRGPRFLPPQWHRFPLSRSLDARPFRFVYIPKGSRPPRFGAGHYRPAQGGSNSAGASFGWFSHHFRRLQSQFSLSHRGQKQVAAPFSESDVARSQAASGSFSKPGPPGRRKAAFS